MDASNTDVTVIIDQMQNEFRSRWDSLNMKFKSLQDSIEEVNIEKEQLKMKLALSREQAVKIEKERDELALTVKEIHTELLSNPLIKLMGKLEQGVTGLEAVHHSYSVRVSSINQAIPESLSRIKEEKVPTSRSTNIQNSSLKNDDTPASNDNTTIVSSSSSLVSSTPVISTCLIQSGHSLGSSESPSLGNGRIFEKDRASFNLVNNSSTPKSLSQTQTTTVNNRTLLSLKECENHERFSYKSHISPSAAESDVNEANLSEVSLSGINGNDVQSVSPNEIVNDSNDSNDSDIQIINIDEFHSPSTFKESGANKSLITSSPKDSALKPSSFKTYVINSSDEEIYSDIELTLSEDKDESSVLNMDLMVSIPRITSLGVLMGDYTVSSSLPEMHKHENNFKKNIVPLAENSKTCGSETVAIEPGVSSKPNHSHSSSTIDVESIPLNMKKKSIECLICRNENRQNVKSYRTYLARNNHLIESHPDYNSIYFRCPFDNGKCKKHYMSKRKLLKHKKQMHHDEDGCVVLEEVPRWLKLRKCVLCDKTFLFSMDFQNHMDKTHRVSKERSNLQKLNEDYDSDSSIESVKSCIVCDETFTTKADLNQHGKQIHPDQFYQMKKLEVDLCEQPKILPRLRSSMDKKSQISRDSSPHSKIGNGREKKLNRTASVQAGNSKKSKQLSSASQFVIENNPSYDTASSKASKKLPILSTVTKTKPKSHTRSKIDTVFEKRKRNRRRWCLICKKHHHKKTFTTPEALDDHILEEHRETGHYIYKRCPYGKGKCKRHFLLKSSLVKHVELDHCE